MTYSGEVDSSLTTRQLSTNQQIKIWPWAPRIQRAAEHLSPLSSLGTGAHWVHQGQARSLIQQTNNQVLWSPTHDLLPLLSCPMDCSELACHFGVFSWIGEEAQGSGLEREGTPKIIVNYTVCQGRWSGDHRHHFTPTAPFYLKANLHSEILGVCAVGSLTARVPGFDTGKLWGGCGSVKAVWWFVRQVLGGWWCRPVFWGGWRGFMSFPHWVSVLCSGGNVSPETQAHKDSGFLFLHLVNYWATYWVLCPELCPYQSWLQLPPPSKYNSSASTPGIAGTDSTTAGVCIPFEFLFLPWRSAWSLSLLPVCQVTPASLPSLDFRVFSSLPSIPQTYTDVSSEPMSAWESLYANNMGTCKGLLWGVNMCVHVHVWCVLNACIYVSVVCVSLCVHMCMFVMCTYLYMCVYDEERQSVEK